MRISVTPASCKAGSGEEPTKPAADDHGFDFLVKGGPLEPRLNIGVLVQRPLQPLILIVGVRTHALSAFQCVLPAQFVGVEAPAPQRVEPHPLAAASSRIRSLVDPRVVGATSP